MELFSKGKVASELQPKVKQKSSEHYISDLVGVFTDPILVYPGGWGDTIPDWLKSAVTLERLIENMKELRGEPPTGTDAEACIYCYTAFLNFPPDRDWVEIYTYLVTKEMEFHRQEMAVPEDIQKKTLSNDQVRDLKHLKAWIYEHRKRARQEKDRAHRREEKQAAEAEIKEAQCTLFDL